MDDSRLDVLMKADTRLSPLSIKFLLGSQLQSAIRHESNIHQSV